LREDRGRNYVKTLVNKVSNKHRSPKKSPLKKIFLKVNSEDWCQTKLVGKPGAFKNGKLSGLVYCLKHFET